MANVDDKVDLELQTCISEGKSFFLFAGAGSGKTYSLVQLLRNILATWGEKLMRENRQVAVITYTNAATDEILRRMDYSPLFHVSTIHSFIWDAIKTYQKDIKRLYLENWQNKIKELKIKLDGAKSKTTRTYLTNKIKYEFLSERRVEKEKINKFVYNPNGDNLGSNSLNHSDVIEIGTKLLIDNPLLQKIVIQQFPFMLIDESQDTKSGLVKAFFAMQHNFPTEFTLGFIGDVKQRIYMDGEESIRSMIPKEWAKPQKSMNYRCGKRIVRLANKISTIIDGSDQHAREDAPEGYAHLFLIRNQDNMNKKVIEDKVCADMKNITQDNQWGEDVKVLTLEHKMAAIRLGFQEIFDSFSKISKYQMSFLQGTIPEMAFFTDLVFPLLKMNKGNDGVGILVLLKKKSPLLEAVQGKDYPEALHKIKSILDGLRNIDFQAKAVDIVEYVKKNNLFLLPDVIEQALHTKLEDTDDDVLMAWIKALQLPLKQFYAYDEYVHDRTPYATHQGVKGLEFPRVLVLIDDDAANGFLFSYDKLFEVKPLSERDIKNQTEGKDNSIDRTARLFYVTCTRAKKSLAILMYTSNPEKAKETALTNGWFDKNEITILENINE